MTADPDHRQAYFTALAGLLDSAWAFEDPDGRIWAVNAAFCAMLGTGEAPSALAGSPWSVRALQLARAARDPGGVSALFAECRAGRVGGELVFDDGRIFEVDHALAGLGGGRPGHVWRFRDVTVGRTHVAALRDAVSAAELANDSRRTFLAGISHEIRTPINAIIGMTELVAETTLDGDMRHLVEGIERNAHRLIGLLDRLLSFTGQRPAVDSLSPAPFSPVALLDATAASCVGDDDVVLLCHRGPDVPRQVVGDKSGIEQILMHLLVFAMADSGSLVEVGVEANWAPGEAPEQGAGDPATRPDDDQLMTAPLRFFVQDDVDRRGLADPAAVLDGVFWQGAGGAEETGLGRQIVFGLVERVGGALTVQPLAEGTRFTLSCRLQVEQGPDRSDPLAGQRVLIADPHPRRRALHAEQCLELGASIRTAADAAGIAAIVAAERLDCALVSDPLTLDVPGIPWIRLAAPGRLDGDEPTCVWRLSLTPQRAELLAGFDRCVRPEPPPPPSGPARVLVVEDLADNALVVRRFLEQAGHRIEVAETGLDALHALRADAWDVVLMDINLPDVDGIEVTARLRDFEARAHLGATPVVALTAYATEDVRDRAEEVGLRAFLTKPVDRWRLLDAIARHGRRGQVGLIVDGDPVGRLLLMRRIRRRASLRPRWAADAAAARAIVDRDPVAFAFVDASLPDGDGLALAAEFVARGIRCALVIDRDDRTLRKQALEMGCREVLDKPVAADAVARVLARLCSSTGALSPIRPRP